MSLTANDRLVLIRVKIERAKKHLRDLESELVSFGDQRSTIITGATYLGFRQGFPEENFQTGVRILTFNAVAAAGDVVHNLRSALDHLAHQLVVAGGGTPDRDTMFPIAKDLNAYESSKPAKVKGMKPQAIKAIDALEPYKGGNDLLWRINELDIIDKHRTLFTVGRDCQFTGDWFDMGPYLLRTQSPNFAGVFDSEAEKDVQLEIDKALSHSHTSQTNQLLPSLHRLVNFVDALLADFL